MNGNEKNELNTFALITGGSKGIGKAIAIELAKRKFNIILVARSLQELASVAKEIEISYGVTVKYYAIDLSTPLAPKFIYEMILSDKANISVLVNNAGFGAYGAFGDQSLDEQSSMLQVNILSLVQLTYRMLPLLRKNTKSYILNIASVAAYQAIPKLALYAASKSFVLSFSRALRLEEKKNNISVTCICPGPVNTNFMKRANVKEGNYMINSAIKGMTPQDIAIVAIEGLFSGKGEIIPGLMNKMTSIATRVLPKSLLEKFVDFAMN